MREIDEYERASAVAPYGDDSKVGDITRETLRRGHAVLEIHRLGRSDLEHVSALLDHMRPKHGARLLDVGCGVGAVAQHMRSLRPDLAITLLNVSPSQLALCPASFPRVAGCMMDLPFARGQFDVLAYLYSLGHGLVDATLKEAARLLEPGGSVFIYDIAAADTAPLIELVGYVAHPVERVLRAARRWGFDLAFFDIPATSTEAFAELVGPQMMSFFAGVLPVLYRFTRA
jgi:ubiquinone/menaquinone biosynthesis C-methylase UbiE